MLRHMYSFVLHNHPGRGQETSAMSGIELVLSVWEISTFTPLYCFSDSIKIVFWFTTIYSILHYGVSCIQNTNYTLNQDVCFPPPLSPGPLMLTTHSLSLVFDILILHFKNFSFLFLSFFMFIFGLASISSDALDFPLALCSGVTPGSTQYHLRCWRLSPNWLCAIQEPCIWNYLSRHYPSFYEFFFYQVPKLGEKRKFSFSNEVFMVHRL